jgi:hypothetical protein
VETPRPTKKRRLFRQHLQHLHCLRHPSGNRDKHGLCFPPGQCSGTQSIICMTRWVLLKWGATIVYCVWSERYIDTVKDNVHALAQVIEVSCGDSHGLFRRHRRWRKGDASHILLLQECRYVKQAASQDRACSPHVSSLRVGRTHFMLCLIVDQDTYEDVECA